MRHTKIVATLGPGSRDRSTIRSLIEAGMDVARVNLAHGSFAEQGGTVKAVREQAVEARRSIGVLVDLPGPKRRTGTLGAGRVRLAEGAAFILTDEPVPGDERRVSTSVDNLSSVLESGEEVLLDDGAILLEVEDVSPPEVRTRVVRGGVLKSLKGMHLPASENKIEAFTDRDRSELEAALAAGVDLVGLSFVRDGEDIERLRAAMTGADYRPLVVAKIETRVACENLEEIVAAADAVMVARGDLGIQVPLKRVPILQKDIIRRCNEAGKPVITATEMLDSMTHEPLPTRAEVTDVANAVLDGTDALMLSAETAVGDYPVQAVLAMSDIAAYAEMQEPEPERRMRRKDRPGEAVSWAVARAAVLAADELRVSAIICPTRSGGTARRVAAFRPRMPVLGLAHVEATVGQLALSWGVVPCLAPFLPEGRVATEGVSRAVGVAQEAGLVRRGDVVVVVAGGPEPRAGSTDLVRIVRV